MNLSLQKVFRVLPVLLLSPGLLHSQFTNPKAVIESPETLVVQPDLDMDGVPDIVVVDRATGVIRPGLYDGSFTWLEPVAGGVAGVTGVAAGPFEDAGFESLALVSEAANRINVFSLDGATLNRAPRSLFTEVVGLSELTAIEEGAHGSAGTIELIGFSGIFEPSLPGFRDYIGLDGGGPASYDPGFPLPDYSERNYRHLLAEVGLPMLGYFEEEVAAGTDRFTLVYTESGSFDLVAQVPVPSGADLIHASFDRSGEFQFVFHEPGSAVIEVWHWDGGGLSPVDGYTLSSPAATLHPFVNDDVAGFLAESLDGLSLTFYAFNGFNPPVPDGTVTPASGLPVGPVVTLPGGRMLVLSGDPSTDPAASAEVFGNSGSGFLSLGATGIPFLGDTVVGSNVLLFADTPFITEDAPLTGRLGAGVWTSVVSVGTTVGAKVESFGGTATGLTNPVSIDLGPPPAGTSDALPNQVDADISLHDPSPAAGVLPGSVTPVPDPGIFAESVTMELIPSGGIADVYYRVLPNGGWNLGTGPAGPFFEDTVVQYFGVAPDGTRTAVETATYDISIPPSELDSDGDGVPDYVEIANGLDPVNSGDDGDGDGYSDLIELLAGSDPNNDLSLPPGRELDSDGDGFSDLEEAIAGTNPGLASSKPASPGVLNFQNVFDLLAVPSSHDGTAAVDPFVPSLDEGLETPGGDPLATNVRLHDLSASLLGFDRTALHGLGGLTDPAAYIEEVSWDAPELPLVVAAERTFNIDVAAADKRLGRQIAALVSVPEASLDPVPYTFGSSGGVVSTEAAAWVTSAKSHYLAITRPQVIREFDLFDTLVLLLVELKIEEILTDRGLLSGDSITLTGFRTPEAPVPLSEAPGDGSRDVLVPQAVLADLRHKASGTDTGYKVSTIFDTINAAVGTNSEPAVAALRSVAEELYRISAATANDNPGTLVAPLDALRQFLRTGSLLNTGYLSDPEVAPLDSTTLASAFSGVPYLLGLDSMRPVDFRQLRIVSGLSTGTCTILEDTTTSETVALLNFQGNPYPLPDAFDLPENTVLIAEGYTDVTSDCPADAAMEVIPPLQLIFLPVAGSGDANGNLIPDDLEDLYAGTLDPFADSDGDGFSDLQEILDGVSPLDDSNAPSGTPVNLSPPVITIDESGSFFVLSFAFPADYADDFNFRLYSGPDPQTMTTDTGLDAPHTGGGSFELTIAKPASLPKFYRFLMEIK